MVFVNRVLKRIFGPAMDEVTMEWRRLHNEELYDLYSSPNFIRLMKYRRMRWAGNVARLGDKRGALRVLVRRPDRKRPLGRPRSRWGSNIKVDLEAVGWGGMEWIDLAQDRDRWRAVVNALSHSSSLCVSINTYNKFIISHTQHIQYNTN